MGLRILFGGFNISLGTVVLLAAVSATSSMALESLFVPDDNNTTTVSLESIAAAGSHAFEVIIGTINAVIRAARFQQ